MLANTTNTGEFALLAPEQLNRERRDILEDAIYQGMPKLVNAILDADNNYIHKAESIDSVMRLLSQRPLEVPIDSFLGDRLDLNQVKSELPAYWYNAVIRGDVGMLRLLMSYDAGFNLEPFGNEQLTKLDIRLRSKQVMHFTQLVAAGLDYNQFEYRGLDQLSHAVSLGDIDLVRAILDLGVNPSVLYRGRSVLQTPINAGLVKQRKIRLLLEKNGAIGSLSSSLPITDNSACSVGKKVALSHHNKYYYLPVKEYMRKHGRRTLETNKVCEVAIGICTSKDEFSLDDCFESLGTCTSREDERGYGSGVSVSTVCCPVLVKQTYNRSRCSGHDPQLASEELKEVGLDLGNQAALH